ncbi:MAG: hypothetical protein HYY76_06625, partial [Acidobacteria bacterium]|nr:hypothetical protein [Acidobacteriota bacterium]
RYVGTFSGIYQGEPRSVRFSVRDGRLFAGAEPLVAQSETLFVSGLGYKFEVDDKGVATHVTEIHISGGYRYARER